MAIDKIIDPNFAANAYLKNTNLARVASTEEDGESGKTSGAGSTGGVSFADVMAEKVQDSIKTMKAGETASAKAVTGEADLTDVIQAVTEAELVLDTVVALRDRMISAYQEIMRMPI